MMMQVTILILSLGSSSATFSVWVKVSTQVANSATYDIISNYDDADSNN